MARTWAEIEALGLTAPEQALVAACKAGEPCVLGDGTRPEGPDPARTVRAEVLRYLILGGCAACRVHETGVWLEGAFVSGALDLSFARARGATGLFACRFEQEVAALQAHFELLSLSWSALPGLNAQRAQVAGGVFLSGGFVAEGEVRLSGATVGGQLACSGGSFRTPEGDALNAQGAQVAGDVFLNGGFLAEGEVSLAGATVGGQLVCGGGSFRNPGGKALNAQGAQVTGDVFLDGGFVAEGEVSLSGATVGGQLACVGGAFRNPGGKALNAQGAQVTGDVFLDGGFAAEGEVSLSGATVGGQLACGGGAFRNPGGKALNAQGAQVTGGVFLRDGFAAEGEVSLSGATVGAQLACGGGSFRNPQGRALNAQRMRVAAGFIFRKVQVHEGVVGLASAQVGDLVDDPESWPGTGRLILDGFTYDKISGEFTDSQRRLQWLAKGTVWNGEFKPQPYAQLAKVLREMGHERGARDVLEEQGRLIRWHERARAHGALNGDWGPGLRSVLADLRFAAGGVSRWVVGYGYKPFRSLFWLLGLWLVAVWLAHMAWVSGAMVPNSDVILTSGGWQAVLGAPNPAAVWSAPGGAGQDWETFNRYAWAFDVVVPILSLGQTEAWAPSTARGGWGWALWGGRWVLTVAGWIVVALAAAAVTGIIRRE